MHDRRRKLEPRGVYANGRAAATLSATTDGSTLKGSQIVDGNSVEIFDGMVNGNELSWKVSIPEPLPMTLEFNGTVNGDELSGSVTLGAFGSSSFSGTRSQGGDA